MKCLNCGSQMKKTKEKLYHYIDSGLSKIYLQGIEISQCSNSHCSDEEISIPNIEELHGLIAKHISSQKNKLLPEEIRFLRTHLGFSGTDFASNMGVSPETVSRWENGSVNMKEASEKLLRVLILSQSGPFRNYQELKEFAKTQRQSPVKRVFSITGHHWGEGQVA